MTQEALKLALEALERSVATCFDQYAHEQVMSRPEHFVNQTITAIKEALAQTQEPVAWLEPEWKEKICPEVGYEVTITDDHPRDLCWIPLYPHPPQRTWVGLEGEEIRNLWEEATKPDRSTMTMVTSFAKSIEAKLKEKNT